MRAPFNTSVTLYDGPGTATPGFPRVVDALCRFVPDDFFVDTTSPFDNSLAYFTITAGMPRASNNTTAGGGVWTFDFTHADRAVFALFPGVTWIVVRVELCTWETIGAPYWRASIAELPPAPVACIETYSEDYYVRDLGDMNEIRLTRTGDTTWAGDGYYLEAELSPATPPGCSSLWRLTHDTCIVNFTYDGEGEVTTTGDDTCPHGHIIRSTPFE